MRKILLIIGGVVVVLAAGAAALWFFVLKSDPEPRAEIEETPVAEETAPIDGTYVVPPGDPDSFVGYRVQEQFVGSIVESTATGRTSDVDGTLTVSAAGTVVEGVDVTANLQTLTSDRSMRDDRIRTLGLESDTFPEATFVLARPIELLEAPEAGETVTATGVGDFTLHGVKRVRIPMDARWDGEAIQVVGSLPVVFADYDMDTPNVGGFVSVHGEGEMEFQLFFNKT